MSLSQKLIKLDYIKEFGNLVRIAYRPLFESALFKDLCTSLVSLPRRSNWKILAKTAF